MFKNNITGKITSDNYSLKGFSKHAIYFSFLDMVTGKLGCPQIHDVAKEDSVGMCFPCLALMKC